MLCFWLAGLVVCVAYIWLLGCWCVIDCLFCGWMGLYGFGFHRFVAYLVGGCVSRILLVVGLLAAVGGVDCVWFICCVMLGLCVDSGGLALIVLLALVYV